MLIALHLKIQSWCLSKALFLNLGGYSYTLLQKLHFMSKNSSLGKTCIVVNLTFRTQFDRRFWIWNATTNWRISNFCLKIGQNLDFWHENSIIQYILGWNIQEYLSTLAQKFNLCLKVKCCQNWIFGQKLNFWNSVSFQRYLARVML